MASGNSLVTFEATAFLPTVANGAQIDVRNGIPVLDFDAATQEYAVASSVLPRHYAGGGITARLEWMGSTAVSGAVVWSAAVERQDVATDLDTDSFATAIAAAAATAPGTSGFPAYTDIALSNAQIDGLVVGERFRLRMSRVAADGGDTMAGDAELVGVELRET